MSRRSTALSVPRAGEWSVRCVVRDAAGNEDRDTAQAVSVKVDDTPPSSRSARSMRNDPRESTSRRPTARRRSCRARPRSVAAAMHDGFRSRQRGRPTVFAGRLDDEHLADGAYEFRALVADSAGNERSTTVDLTGHVAVRQVPGAGEHEARRSVGATVASSHRESDRGIRTTGCARAGGSRRRARIRSPTPISKSGSGPSCLASQSRRVAIVKTNRAGSFRFKTSSGASRILRFRYPGTSIVRARTSEVTLAVRAKTTLRTQPHASRQR